MKAHLSLVIVIISTAVFMPLMIFMFANSSAFAGNMVRVEGRNPDGDIVAMEDGGELLEADGNAVIVEGIDDPGSASLCIPLSDDTDVNQIGFADDPVKGRIDIAIPTEVKNFYYKNELTGTRKGITGLVYDYKNNVARFVLSTDKYYISALHLSGDQLYLTLKTPKEVYGHVCIIDPAHGGEDTGSMAYGVSEKDVALELAKSVIQSAEADGDGGFFTVRDEDKEITDAYKQHLVSILEPDVYITFQMSADENTRTTNGVSAAAKDSEAKKIADDLTAAISAATGQANLGAALDSSVGGEKEVRNIVLYLGYITNKKEALLVNDAAYDATAGKAIHEVLSANTDNKGNE